MYQPPATLLRRKDGSGSKWSQCSIIFLHSSPTSQRTKRFGNILPANWEDDNVIVEHHANNEDAEAEQLKSKEVLPAHTNARQEVTLF